MTAIHLLYCLSKLIRKMSSPLVERVTQGEKERETVVSLQVEIENKWSKDAGER